MIRKLKMGQLGLFDGDAGLPEGLQYQAGLISDSEEAQLLHEIKELPFKAFEFHGHLGNRRVVSFGWQYDFSTEKLRKTEDMPGFLLPVWESAARFAGIAASELQHVLITEYGPGAGIGWHRDKAVFGKVVGISLLSNCTFRLRRKAGLSWERASLVAERGSVYLLDGPSRTEWEHSIPPVESLRYSLTFRNLRSP